MRPMLQALAPARLRASLTAGQPGSCEADLVQRLVKGTVGYDDELLEGYGQEPAMPGGAPLWALVKRWQGRAGWVMEPRKRMVVALRSMTASASLGAGRRPVWLPWMAGPHEAVAATVLVSLTEFRAHAWRDLPGMAWIGLALRAGWYGLPGAVGLYLCADVPRRCVGSLSVWTDAADLRRWIGLPRHVEVMRRYRPRGTARSTKWTSETFDRKAILAEGKRRLASGALNPIP
jgi:hypothetical protein